MLHVVCILKSGGVYQPHHVETLRTMVERHLPTNHQFVCLSDVEPSAFTSKVWVLPLVKNWPGWWSKIEMFNDETYAMPGDRILYFDLDTIILGSLKEIAERKERFIIMGDVYRRPPRACAIQFQSSMMMWNARELTAIYAQFGRGNPLAIMQRYKVIGDQGWIQSITQNSAALWEKVLPGQVVSYKRDCQPLPPAGTRVVIFHGHPKPWQVSTRGWVREAYA